MGIGNHIASNEFTGGGYQWAIYFYPDGKNKEEKSEFVSVYVTLMSEGTNVRALFELKLVDQSGQGKHKVLSHFVHPLETGPYTLKTKGSMWVLSYGPVWINNLFAAYSTSAYHDKHLHKLLTGYKRFFRRNLLESSDFLKNDCLEINCTVGVVVSATDCPQLNSIHVAESDIGSHFGAPLENMEGSDVTIDSGVDWQEEVYQKMQTMKEITCQKLMKYARISMRLHQHDSMPQQPKSDRIEKMRQYKTMLERMIAFLQLPKNSIVSSYKEKLGAYERQIVGLINSVRPRRGTSSLQPGQLPPSHMDLMPQSQSQVTPVQSHENQMNS